MSKNVALALASGGPRGFAYIGAIEVLQERGYQISSIAGASAGALVGGIFAAGGLEAFKQWLLGLDPLKIAALTDLSLSKNYLVKGERVMDAIRGIVPEVNIEDLPIPYVAVATDLYTGEEVLFREGPVFEAVRASISIPSMFRPVKWKGRTLVDGGMVNTFPLNRAVRTPGDILVGFNVNEIDAAQIQGFLDSRADYAQRGAARRAEARNLLKDTLATAERGDFLEKMARGGHLLRESIDDGRGERRLEADGREGWIPVDADDNYASILQRSFGIMNSSLSRQAISLCPPDVLASLPFDSYHGVYGYSHAGEIIAKGRELMGAALDRFEANQK